MRMAGRLIWVFGLLIVCLANIWAAAALYFDLPAEVAPSILVAIFYLAAVVALLFTFRFTWLSLGISFALFAVVALWWCSIKPPKLGIGNRMLPRRHGQSETETKLPYTT
jgi:hypothetical protein